MTAFGSLETAIEAMRQGAYDYLTKPFKLAEVTLAIRRALDDQRLRAENARLRAEVERQLGLERVVGRSRAIQSLLEQVRAVADSDASVLLLGESGTGKELVARALHWSSSRARRALRGGELRRGARVPAGVRALRPREGRVHRRRPEARRALRGRARRHALPRRGGRSPARHAGEAPARHPGKGGAPGGGRRDLQLDLRLVTATNRDLAALVPEGKFREDLYYRLAVIPIRLPALRERPEDIPLLAEHFLRDAAERLGKRWPASPPTRSEWMREYRWPGNVRELENVVERAAVLAAGPIVTLADLRTEFSVEPAASALRPTLDELERQYIRRVLDEVRATSRRRPRSSASPCARSSAESGTGRASSALAAKLRRAPASTPRVLRRRPDPR